MTVFVPHYAMSGGTLIALAADEILMDPHAVLGPVDPQLGEMPAASIMRVVRSKEVAQIDDRFLVLADVAEKALRQVIAFVTDLLDDRMPPEKAQELADLLAGGHFTHDFPITVERANELGLQVTRRASGRGLRPDGAVPPGHPRPPQRHVPAAAGAGPGKGTARPPG